MQKYMRTAEADAAEDELRKMLACAGPGHPIMLRLKQPRNAGR